jgi:CTP synthase
MKYIFITGGVVSSLGKGIAAASIGLLLKQRGVRVVIQKFDPYLNVDPGTMSPFQHGEVYVTDDGGETDLDLGHYERFLDQNLTREQSVTAGKVYQAVIERERAGGYLGKTVQVVPHITDEIKNRIRAAGDNNDVDVVITEIGGTTGDIESLPFLEACRQMRHEDGADNVLFIHLVLVPYIKAAREIKTKPTQHSVKGLLEIGIQPDILLCRTEEPLGQEIRSKISLFCNVRERAVIEARDVASIYHVPLHLHREGLDDIVLKLLHLEARQPDLEKWERMIQRMTAIEDDVTIAVVGKYVQIQDAYKSIIESFTHAGIENDVHVTIRWVDAEDVEKLGAEEALRGVGGVLVPGGFGERGITGKVEAIKYARENDIPFLGICLGLQCAVIEFARDVCGIEDALSSEFSPNCPNPVIDLMEGQTHSGKKGGTMRLGAYPCKIQPDTLAAELYGEGEISERHRHRWEVNNEYRETLARHGLAFSGTSPDGSLVEIIEIPEHSYFIASQFHPELKSRPNRAHPMFFGLVRAAKAQRHSHSSPSARPMCA